MPTLLPTALPASRFDSPITVVALGLAAGLVLACDTGDGGARGDGGADSAAALPTDAAASRQDGSAVVFGCDPASRRAVVEGLSPPYTCAAAPELVAIMGGGIEGFEIFKYEASHPLASKQEAFPCANGNPADPTDTTGFRAPEGQTEPCSRAGVRPWHSVRWEDADASCRAYGFRLCTGEELLRACGGAQGYRFTYGRAFEDGKCNVQAAWAAPEQPGRVSEAPTGTFPECVSPDGVFDVNGNLWEWTADRNGTDDRNHFYQGAGWRIIAERHDDENQSCEERSETRGISARTFANSDVGFRCCRDL